MLGDKREVLARLTAAYDAELTAIRWRQQLIIVARAAQASWSEIGQAIGYVRETARQRHKAAVRDLGGKSNG